MATHSPFIPSNHLRAGLIIAACVGVILISIGVLVTSAMWVWAGRNTKEVFVVFLENQQDRASPMTTTVRNFFTRQTHGWRPATVEQLQQEVSYGAQWCSFGLVATHATGTNPWSWVQVARPAGCVASSPTPLVRGAVDVYPFDGTQYTFAQHPELGLLVYGVKPENVRSVPKGMTILEWTPTRWSRRTPVNSSV